MRVMSLSESSADRFPRSRGSTAPGVGFERALRREPSRWVRPSWGRARSLQHARRLPSPSGSGDGDVDATTLKQQRPRPRRRADRGDAGASAMRLVTPQGRERRRRARRRARRARGRCRRGRRAPWRSRGARLGVAQAAPSFRPLASARRASPAPPVAARGHVVPVDRLGVGDGAAEVRVARMAPDQLAQQRELVRGRFSQLK